MQEAEFGFYSVQGPSNFNWKSVFVWKYTYKFILLRNLSQIWKIEFIDKNCPDADQILLKKSIFTIRKNMTYAFLGILDCVDFIIYGIVFVDDVYYSGRVFLYL